jgi:multiple sugar transport system ATP-binding protein
VPQAFRAAVTAGGGKAGTKVVLGIRPKSLRAQAREGGGPTVSFSAKTEFVEPLGHEVIVHGRVGDDLLVAKVDPHLAPVRGQDVPLVLEVEACHLFDAASEKRLGTT